MEVFEATVTPPTGAQYLLTVGHQEATVTEVGAGLRSYKVGGVELLDTFAENELCDDARGQMLIPWPNRVADGRWTTRDGRRQQLDITEPELGHAIHGLTRWLPWSLASWGESHLELRVMLGAQNGWPHPLKCRQIWTLTKDGLRSQTTIANVGVDVVGCGLGAHPYLRGDDPTIDTSTVTVPADTVILNDARLIPTNDLPVEGTMFDLRSGSKIGPREIDNAYTGLSRDERGRAVVTLDRSVGTVALWCDETFPYLEIYTAHDLVDVARRRTGLGVEPMTAPPNAIQTGRDLLLLGPGDSHTSSWGIQLLR